MPAISREHRQANLTAARQWRIDNKPYFDAIYGPEGVRSSCPTCGHSPRVVTAGDVL